MTTNILSFSRNEIDTLITNLGENSFRANQLWQWIWQKNILDFHKMTNLSKILRQHLSENYLLAPPLTQKISKSSDGTVKFLLLLADKNRIECVLIPEKTHYTLCISSQVGCKLGCTFCCTGKQGFTRNLAYWEIAAQVLIARNFLRENQNPLHLKNLVIMGMGEPLLNFKEIQKAFDLFSDPDGLNFSRRKITLSTVGIDGALQEFARLDLGLPAISLHAPNQELRHKLMPGASKELSLDKLIKILKSYPLRPRERITIEYILLGGINDSPDHARQLVRLLTGLQCKINLIAYNAGAGNNYQTPNEQTILDFEKILWNKGMTAILRKSKGSDISAACGQLAAQNKKEKQ